MTSLGVVTFLLSPVGVRGDDSGPARARVRCLSRAVGGECALHALPHVERTEESRERD